LRAAAGQDKATHGGLPTRPWPLLGRYILRHLPVSVAAFLAVIGGASCAVGAQYGLKLLVDRMASGTPAGSLLPLISYGTLFLTLLAAENACWRIGGWLGSRAIIGSVSSRAMRSWVAGRGSRE
jgi:ATP-binding cassette subfamily B protein